MARASTPSRTSGRPPEHLSGSRRRVALGYGVLGVVALVTWTQVPGPFITTQLAFTYDLGLIPRGLWGTAMTLVGLMPTRVVLTGLSGYVLAAAAGTCGLAILAVPDDEAANGRVLLGAALLLSPAGLPFLAANLGRLDTPMLLCAGLGAAALAADRRWGPPVAGALIVAAVLVHEAAGLAIVPVLAAWAWRRCGPRTGLMLLTVGIATTALITLLPMPVPPARFAAFVQERIVAPDPFALALPYQGLGDALARARHHLAALGPIGVLRSPVLPVAPLVALTVLARRDAGRSWRQLGGRDRTLLLACATPLLLSALGTDIGRWAAMAAMELTIVSMWLIPAAWRPRPVHVALGVSAVLMTFVVGPIRL